MRIWLAVNGEPTPFDKDIPRLYRVGILAEKLASRGHDVTWWTANTYHQKATQRTEKTEIHDLDNQGKPLGYRLVLLNGMGYPKKFSPKRVISHFQNAWEFVKLSKSEEKPDVIFCCYPQIELAYALSRYAKKHDIPIIMDFRDKWPDVIEDNLSTVKKIAGFPLLLFWRHAQKYCVRNAAAITGITDAFVDWALSCVKRKRSNKDTAFHLSVNPATPEQSDMEKAALYWDTHDIVARPDEGHVICCYAGMLSNRVDLLSLVHGAKALSPTDKAKIKIVLCGTGDAEDELLELTKDEPHIFLAGWRSAADLNVLMERSDFGLLPYFSFDDFMMSYPNKVGEYFAAGLPIMTSLTGITGDLIKQENVGVMVEERNPSSYTSALSTAIQNRDVMRNIKPVPRKIFEEMFDGAKIYPALCDYIESFAKK